MKRKMTQAIPSKIRFITGVLMVVSTTAYALPSVDKTVKIGNSVYEIAYNPKLDEVYVATSGPVSKDGYRQAGIVVVDARTLEKKKTIDVGHDLPFGIALNVNTQKLYASDSISGVVAVYDLKTGMKLHSIRNPASQSPLREIVIDARTNTIFASSVGGFQHSKDKPAPQSTVWVIDGNTDTVIHTILDPVKSATGMVFDNKTRKLYVADFFKNEIAEIDPATCNVVRTFPSTAVINGNPAWKEKADGPDTINLAFDSDKGRIFAVNQASGNVSVISAKDGRLIKNINTGAGSLSAKYDSKTNKLYVANRGDGTVTIINGDTYRVEANLYTGTHPQSIAINPSDGIVYVSNRAKGYAGNVPEGPLPYEPGGDTLTRIRP
ncbi:YncE family protein [Klebsiella pneumoniae subsp. pneumoniae]|uniref:YncE family protein n=1 Tax=Klebsiella pneumoniae TaxID=573 RepID=UPI0021B3205B|nr:YncE family protein [Klebsiella pneumoniae]MCT6795103.1 YncE family protein [Klebsiella pneumoniae subsp. pneumoniae]